LNIVIGDAKITLAALPVKPFSNKAKLVNWVLTEAERKVKINLVLMDRGFFTKDVIKVLEMHHLKFLFPVPKNKLVKQMIKDAHKSKNFVAKYEFKRRRKVVGSFTIFFLLDPDSKERAIWKRYRVFGTNLPVINDIRENLAEVYRMRWGIETSYRVEKHDFLAKTTSKSYKFRLFLFLVAVILYNFWMITRMVYGKKFYARKWKNSIYILLYSSSLQSVETMKDSEIKNIDF
jgi:IS4 transposase